MSNIIRHLGKGARGGARGFLRTAENVGEKGIKTPQQTLEQADHRLLPAPRTALTGLKVKGW